MRYNKCKKSSGKPPKSLTPEILGEINEMILRAVAQPAKHEDDDDQGDGGNSGTMIVDATCAPSNIRYPQDCRRR